MSKLRLSDYNHNLMLPQSLLYTDGSGWKTPLIPHHSDSVPTYVSLGEAVGLNSEGGNEKSSGIVSDPQAEQ